MSLIPREPGDGDIMGCLANCSGHGECLNGSCYCMIQFQGSECSNANFSWHVGFSSIFFLLALTSLIQLVMCIHADFLRQKTPSVVRACRITTQKLLYFLVFLASTLRGTYFATPRLGSTLSASLMSAYYPVLLTGSSLVVCFWAEVFHLQEVRWEKPRFLSKSWLGFVIFNVITYSLLMVEFFLIWYDYDDHQFWSHIFNGCYAGLMFIVVIFFLIYGVEVFFKVRGGFTMQRVPQIINSRSDPIPKLRSGKLNKTKVENIEEEKPMMESQLCGLIHKRKDNEIPQEINQSQLHQSRLGLLSQALMMIITVGFLFSETLSEFWKGKVDLTSRNTHMIIFRVVEIGVALWFPCVLWNCIRPEQLWILNPKKILATLSDRHPPESDHPEPGMSTSRDSSCSTDSSDGGAECWICYDTERTDAGALIQPCACKGDVGAVHHNCLVRWLVESADNPQSLACKVCSQAYQVERGSQFSLAQGFTTKHWLGTAFMVFVMSGAAGGCWATIQLYTDPWIRTLAVGIALLVCYVCLRFLGLNTMTAYQRAKVYSLKVLSKSLSSGGVQLNTVSEHVGHVRASRIDSVQEGSRSTTLAL